MANTTLKISPYGGPSYIAIDEICKVGLQIFSGCKNPPLIQHFSHFYLLLNLSKFRPLQIIKVLYYRLKTDLQVLFQIPRHSKQRHFSSNVFFKIISVLLTNNPPAFVDCFFLNLPNCIISKCNMLILIYIVYLISIISIYFSGDKHCFFFFPSGCQSYFFLIILTVLIQQDLPYIKPYLNFSSSFN